MKTAAKVFYTFLCTAGCGAIGNELFGPAGAAVFGVGGFIAGPYMAKMKQKDKEPL